MFLLTTALSLLPTLPVGADESALTPFLVPAESHDESRRAAGTDFSYTYLELGYASYNVDATDEDADTYYARGSVGFLDFLYAFGQYENQNFDVGDFDTDLITVGAGAHFDLMNNLDLFGEVGWLFTDSDFDDDNGFLVSGGARWMALPWENGGLEVNGEVGYYDLDLAGEDGPIFWELGLRGHFLTHFSVGLAYQMIEDDDQVIGNLRYSF